MVRTRSIAVNTVDAALATEPECLGPCEPGTSVNLEGIVWQETEDGEKSVITVDGCVVLFYVCLFEEQNERSSEAHRRPEIVSVISLRASVQSDTSEALALPRPEHHFPFC